MVRLRALLRGALVAVASSAVVLAGSLPASADPTLDDAKKQLAAIEDQQSKIGEEWSEARLELADGQAKVKTLDADIAAQQTKVDTLRGQAQRLAITRYQTRGVDITVQLITSPDPDEFLSDLTTMGKVDQNLNSVLQDYQAQKANLDALKRAADDQVTELAAQEQRLAGLKEQIDAKTKESQELVDRLTEEERQRLLAEQAASRQASDRAAVDEEAIVDASGSADERAVKAVKYAVAKVPGSSYVWGAEGPNSFDCSGLMLAAYRTVGISLPHSSRAQFGVGRAVSRDALKPGDLLFFYNPIHHVGMYIGNGLFVHARNPRDGLEITKLASYPAYQGARRVIG